MNKFLRLNLKVGAFFWVEGAVPELSNYGVAEVCADVADVIWKMTYSKTHARCSQIHSFTLFKSY